MIEKAGDRGGSIVAKGAIGFGTAHLLAKHCHGKKDADKIPIIEKMIKESVDIQGLLKAL